MLEDLIRAYEEALEKEDKGTMQMIERELRNLGMDKMSLLTIVRERRKEHGKEV